LTINSIRSLVVVGAIKHIILNPSFLPASIISSASSTGRSGIVAPSNPALTATLAALIKSFLILKYIETR
jgi:hypothetical protein